MILVEHINPVDGALLVGIVSRDAPGQRFRFQSLGLVDTMTGYVGVGQLFLSPTKVLTSAPHMSKLLASGTSPRQTSHSSTNIPYRAGVALSRRVRPPCLQVFPSACIVVAAMVAVLTSGIVIIQPLQRQHQLLPPHVLILELEAKIRAAVCTVLPDVVNQVSELMDGVQDTGCVGRFRLDVLLENGRWLVSNADFG